MVDKRFRKLEEEIKQIKGNMSRVQELEDQMRGIHAEILESNSTQTHFLDLELLSLICSHVVVPVAIAVVTMAALFMAVMAVLSVVAIVAVPPLGFLLLFFLF